jgi:hypothetical protein
MSRKRSNATGRRESGSYVALPHSLLQHENFAKLSPRATKLFLDLASVYKGNNNGDMSIARLFTEGKIVKGEKERQGGRGWTSRDQVYKALQELLDRGFAIKTRQGGRSQCCLYALTIWAIDECKGKLDVSATRVASNAWKSFSVVRQADQPIPPHGRAKAKYAENVVHLVRHTDQSG